MRSVYLRLIVLEKGKIVIENLSSARYARSRNREVGGLMQSSLIDGFEPIPDSVPNIPRKEWVTGSAAANNPGC